MNSRQLTRDQQLLREHRQYLQSKNRNYLLFDKLEQAQGTGKQLGELREHAVRVVELAPAGVEPQVRAAFAAVLKLGGSRAITAMHAWAASADQASEVSDRTLKMLYSCFGSWLDETTEAAAPHFLDALPKLTPVLVGLKADGVTNLVRLAESLKSDEAQQVYWRIVSEYGDTKGQVVWGIAKVAHQAYHCDQLENIDKLVKTIGTRKLMAHRDGRKLVPALGLLSDEARKLGKNVWTSAFSLISVLDTPNSAARYIATVDIRRMIRRGISRDQAVQYLEAYRRLVEAFGLRVVHFARQELPKLMQHHGQERTCRFVDLAITSAEMYGSTAGWSFLARKSPAAAQLLK